MLSSPAYLLSGALMMSVATMSSSQTIMAMKIHDETVYKQTSMNKKYKRKLKLLKKYQSLKSKHHTVKVVDSENDSIELIDLDKMDL